MEASASANPVTPLDDLWRRIDGHLRARLRPDLYDRWFAPLRPISIDGGRLQIAAPDKFHRDFVEDNYRAWFEEFLPALAGQPLRIAFAVDDTPRASAPPPPPTPRPGAPPPPPPPDSGGQAGLHDVIGRPGKVLKGTAA